MSARTDGQDDLPGDDSRRIGALDGLRAISICLVLATHLLPLGPKTLQLNANAGAMGMGLFFALSGFLIMRALQTSSVPAFLVRRASRLVPLAWLYLVVIWLMHPLSLEALATGLLFGLNYRPDLMLPQTEHLWSLGVEMHFYLAIALAALIDRRAIWLVWPVCLLITALRIAEGAHLSIVTHLRVDEILAGACVALLPAAWLARGTSNSVAPWFAALAVWALSSHPESGALQFVRPYATAMLLVLTLRLPEGAARQALEAPIARYIASISYALYVIHPLTAHGWWNAGTAAERYLIKRPLSLAITFVLAHLSTRWWESFWIHAARRWIHGRQSLGHGPLSVLRQSSTAERDVVEVAAPSAHRPAVE